MKVWLIQPPKYFWPYVNADDNYLVPQALPCLAAVLRRAGHEARIIDCAPRRTGWKTLAAELRRGEPDAVGVGESHALYSGESLRALRLVKETLPRAVTIAGGVHFSNLVDETLASGCVDFLVRMEGEATLVELLSAIEAGAESFEDVRGIAYNRNGKFVRTPPRPLIEDLDSLPLPAYDLLPMDRYGASRFLFSPGGTTIHHSRGCVSNCSFCCWWIQMADVEVRGGEWRYVPRWRTKSVDRVIEEIRLLSSRYRKRCLVFVDEYWNRDAAWNDEFAEKLIRSGLKTLWFAFMRVDGILRDEKLGIFEKLVRSGLCHVSIGVERAEDEELKKMNKPFYRESATIECFRLLSDRYPGVFRQGTFIVGIRDETKESMFRQFRFAKALDLDYPGFHPLTPVPGTPLWREAKEKGWIEVEDFSRYDWLTPVMSSRELSRRRIEELTIEMSRRYVTARWFLRGLFSRSAYKRNMYIWWLIVTIRMVFASLRRKIYPLSRGGRVLTELVKPPWYDD
ncbi:MAG: radical SAM protein [bacterium]